MSDPAGPDVHLGEVSMLWLLAMVVAASARSPCKELKPKKKPSPESMNLVSSVLQTAVGVAGVPLPVSPSTIVSGLGSLAGNDQARDWFLYQVCTLKEAGMLSPEKAEEIVASTLGGGGGASTATSPPPGLAPDILAIRQRLVQQAEMICGTSGMESACPAYQQMVVEFDKAHGR